MKIVLIGPGLSPIPPKCWGAVESIVWDYYEELTNMGHKVVIVNVPDFREIISKTNQEVADVVYIMYDDHIVLAPHIQCRRIFYMSHYAYITEPGFEQKRAYYFHNIFMKVIENQKYITLNAISSDILSVYQKYGYTGKSNIIRNGARSDCFRYTENPVLKDRSIYIGKIEERKGQYKYQTIPGIDFAGNYHSSPFATSNPNYLGEWSKPVLYENLTNYSNLILLSDGEADPLVVKEGLIAGLGVVVSECSAANLDRSKPFITVIPNDRLLDLDYISQKIAENREISITMRSQIREYALMHFSWTNIVGEFLEKCREPLRIALIGPGIMPIPPKGWGAVEILIWDYYQELTRLGHKVVVINTPDRQQIVELVNRGRFDFVHLHYDVFWDLLDKFICPKIAITSHYPYIDQPEKHRADGYDVVFKNICNNSRHFIFALSKKDYDMFSKYAADTLKIRLILNGSNHREIVPIENGCHKEKSIYIAKIENRKQQYKYCSIPNIDFYGRCDDVSFRQKECYKGEPSREELMGLLSNYGNFVLLSNGENGTPLVIKEALMAGLPIVINRFSANDLDISLPFIDIIPDDKLNDLEYIEKVIIENRKKNCHKESIRKYAVLNFSWKKLVKKYCDMII